MNIAGVTALALGIYLCVKDPRPIQEWADFILNPAILLIIIGLSLECCGVSSMSQGFRDWQLNEQYNCNASNPYPEKCGVPYSCCRRSVISEAAGSLNPLVPAMRSLQCWQNAQTKRTQDLETDIYVRGCLQPVRTLFESHAVHLGAIVAVFIIPVCFSVCLSHLLARQIDYQKYLLDREERQFKRRQNRERQRLQHIEKKQSRVIEQQHLHPIPPPTSTIPPGPPQIINTSLPKKSVDETSKEQQAKRHKRRAVSTSPLRINATNSVSIIPSGPEATSTRLQQPSSAVSPRKQHKKRRRSLIPSGGGPPPLPNGATIQSPPPQIPPTTNPSDFRTHQWVLQQSDISGKK
uniref:Tetraspanin n=1 Tax=Panagrolaimus sp. ES5 TaxID=591445 RepID=A0AC34GU05_9BILA